MAYRAKSITSAEHSAQHKPQRRALKALKRSGLMKRLDDLIADTTPYVQKEMGVTPAHARYLTKRWILEAVAEYVYMNAGDVLFIEHDHD